MSPSFGHLSVLPILSQSVMLRKGGDPLCLRNHHRCPRLPGSDHRRRRSLEGTYDVDVLCGFGWHRVLGLVGIVACSLVVAISFAVLESYRTQRAGVVFGSFES